MLFRVVVALAFQDPRGALRRSIYLKRLLIPGSIKMITLDPRLRSLLSWERLPRGARTAGGEGEMLAYLFKDEEVKAEEALGRIQVGKLSLDGAARLLQDCGVLS